MTQIERLFDHSPMAEAVWSLRFNQCKYPIGDEDSFAFCHDKRAEGSSYCAHHHAISNIAGSHRPYAKAVTRTKTKPVRQKPLLEIPAFEFKPVLGKPRKPKPAREPRPVVMPARKYQFGDQSLSLNEWSERLGIKMRTLRGRLAKGWTIEQAFSNEAILGQRVRTPTEPRIYKAPRTARRYDHNGRSLTLRQWSEEIGIKQSTLRNRISNGWTIEQALMPTFDKSTRPLGRNASR